MSRARRQEPLVNVSDHAVLRYLERAMGFDIAGVRRHIEQTCAGAAVAGATALRADGVVYIMEQGRVITVKPGGPGHALTRVAKLARAGHAIDNTRSL